MRKINTARATQRPVRLPEGFRYATGYGEVNNADIAAYLAARRPGVPNRDTPEQLPLRIRYQGQWMPARIDYAIRSRRAPSHNTPSERVGVYVTGPDFPARRVAAGEIAVPVTPPTEPVTEPGEDAEQ